ncbi:MAG: flagellar biosynthesis anti-sigma factor FlgM [Deltaproteobacteria bacterium]|nr:flagellar biosynthesis anti-sigma factor FlgM [Deltaproteobacteria bacterium]
MKVSNEAATPSVNREQSTQASEKTKKTSATKSLQKTTGADTTATDYDVNLSQGSKELTQAYEKAFAIAKNTPDVREDKVKELKEKISKGLYRIDSGAVADGILKEAVRDRLATRE